MEIPKPDDLPPPDEKKLERDKRVHRLDDIDEPADPALDTEEALERAITRIPPG